MKSILACCFLLGFSVSAFAAEPEAKEADGKNPPKKIKPKFTIGKETTFVTGSLDKDGCIDYVAALNERLGKGITAENNANVLIWKAIGPRPQGRAAMPPEFFKQLEMEGPSEKGEYLIELGKYLNETLMIDKAKCFELEEQWQLAFRRPWTAKDFPEIAAWLKLNEKPLVLIVEANKRSRYFSPFGWSGSGKGKTSIIGSVSGAQFHSRVMANALICRSMLRMGDGQFDQAWQDLLAAHRHARLLRQGGTMTDTLIGIAIESLVSSAELVFLERAKFDAEQIQQCLSDLQALPPLANVADIINLTERFSYLEIALKASDEGMWLIKSVVGLQAGFGDDNQFEKELTNFLDEKKIDWSDVDRNPILRDANILFDSMVAALGKADRQDREKQFERLEAKRQELTLPAIAELRKALENAESEPVAKAKLMRFLFGYAYPRSVVRQIQQAVDRAEQNQRNLHIAFALAAYQRDHRGYPKMLDALTPKYLTKIPDDLFTGKPLTYRPNEKGYLLYSFGPSGKDDGGRANFDKPPGDDLTVRMPIPEFSKK